MEQTAYRTIRKVFGTDTGKRSLGITGESLATQLIICVKNVLVSNPDAYFSLLLYRPDRTQVCLPAPDLRPDENGEISYLFTFTEALAAGEVTLEAQAREGGALIKSCTWAFDIAQSVQSMANLCPPPADWVDKVVRASHDANEAANDAATSDASAQEAAERASQSETSAAESKDAAADSAEAARQSEENAGDSATAASGSAQAAAQSATAASLSEQNAAGYAEVAESNFQMASFYVDSVAYLHQVTTNDTGAIRAQVDDEMTLHIQIKT